MGNKYRAGDWLAICDRCGQEYYASELLLDWKQLRVCSKCWEPQHPNEFLRVPAESPGVPWARPPDPDPPFVIDSGVEFWSIPIFAIPPMRDVQALRATANGDGTYEVLADCLDHRFTNGDTVTIAGAASAGFNGAKSITIIGQHRFRYTVASNPGANEVPAVGVTADGILKETNPVTFERWLITEWPRRVFHGELVT